MIKIEHCLSLTPLLIVTNALLCRQHVVEAKRLTDDLSKLPYRPLLTYVFSLSLSLCAHVEQDAHRQGVPRSLALCFSAYKSLSTLMIVTRDSWTYRLYLLSQLSFKATTNDFRSNVFNDQDKWKSRNEFVSICMKHRLERTGEQKKTH